MGILAYLGVLRTPLRVLSSIFLLSTPLRTPHKLSVRERRTAIRRSIRRSKHKHATTTMKRNVRLYEKMEERIDRDPQAN